MRYKIQVTCITTHEKVRQRQSKDASQCFYKQPILLCTINLNVWREIVNLKITKNPFSIAIFLITSMTQLMMNYFQ